MEPISFNARGRVLSIFLVVTFLTVSACGGGGDVDNPSTLKAGDVIETDLSVDDQVAVSTTYKVYELEPADGKEALVMVKENETIYPEVLRRASMEILRQEEEEELVTYAGVMSFLENHWDEHINGLEDEGVNSYEFVQYLQEINVSLTPFLREFKRASAAGMALDQFIATLNSTASNLTTDSPEEFLGFLDYTGKNMREFLDSTLTCYSNWEAFLQELNSRQLTFQELFTRYKNNGDEICTAVISAEREKNIWQDAAAALKVAKWVWQVIKDNAPEVPEGGAFTSVLNGGDTNALNYEYAKNSSGRKLQWRGRNIFRMTLFRVNFSVNATYDASHKDWQGHYIPNIHFTIPYAHANWPWKMNAVAKLSGVSNLASADDPDPQVTMEINLNAKWFLQSSHRSYNFTIRGSTGVVQ